MDSAQNAEAVTAPQGRRGGKIDIGVAGGGHFIGGFLLGAAALTAASLALLGIDWVRLAGRAGDIGLIFWRMAHFTLDHVDFTLLSFMDTFSIMVLATVYSLFLGLAFGLLAARNITGPVVSPVVKAVFTFLRAVPTPVWVLLTLVCFGFGPVAGITGLSVHTVAFFTKSFAQAFEDVPEDTVDALRALGATRLQIIACGILPSAATQLIAWTALRFEINFSECAILGMVGAGGIGFAISAAIQNYDYGEAGLAVFLVFLFAFAMERGFLYVKKIMK